MASAVPAGGVGRHVQAGEEAGDTAAGRRRAGVVPASGAGLPDADQPGSAEGDDRGEKEKRGIESYSARPIRAAEIPRFDAAWNPTLRLSSGARNMSSSPDTHIEGARMGHPAQVRRNLSSGARLGRARAPVPPRAKAIATSSPPSSSKH